MNNDNPLIHDLEDALNSAGAASMHASEETLAFAHGYYIGIYQAITAMGYKIEWNDTVYRFFIEPDPFKNRDSRTYAHYTAHILINCFVNYLKSDDPEHDQAIIDGIREVLAICGYEVSGNLFTEITIHKNSPVRS